MSNKKPISITLDETLVAAVDELCSEADRNRSWLIERAVVLYLAELEDLEEALQLSKEPRENFISSKQLRDELGI